jgi:hypothetical protein
MATAPDKLQPAFFGGLFIGVLSALPIVNMGNCCCCLWVLAGGALTSYLMQQNYPYAIRTEDGLLGGLLAGVIGGVIGVVLSIPLTMMMGGFQQRMLERIAENPDMPQQTRDIIERMAARGGIGALRVVGGLVNICISAVFGMLGGLIGVALFKKKDVPPPGTTEVLPPA